MSAVSSGTEGGDQHTEFSLAWRAAAGEEQGSTGADRLKEKVRRLLFDSLFSETVMTKQYVMCNVSEIATALLSFQNKII